MTQLHVFNKRDGVPTVPHVLVDRSTVWGNPYRMTMEDDRDGVCEAFEYYAIQRAELQSDWLVPLRGKNLLCWCAPKRCHADTLLRLANKEVTAE